MLAAAAVRTDANDPLGCLEVGERPDPQAPDGWATVRLRAMHKQFHPRG